MNLEHIKQLHPEGQCRASLLLVHGACMGAWVWQENFLPFLFEKGFNVHAISLRNHGGSSRKGRLVTTSVFDYVDDLKSIIEALDGDVFIIGHSMGGFTVQHYLSQCSSKVKGVVLLCSVPNTGLWRLIPTLLISYPLHFIVSCLKMSWLPFVKNEKRLKRLMFSELFPVDKMNVMTKAMQEESFLAFLEMAFLRLPSLESSPVPMMVVGGEKDFLVSVESTKRMASFYGVEPFIIKEAAHCFMLEVGWEKAADKIACFIGDLIPKST